jgi:hypothetical protein
MRRLQLRASHVRLAAILALALGLRLGLLVWLGGARVPWLLEYEQIADRLFAGGGYAFDFYGYTPALPTAFLPPIYPFFLMVTKLVFSHPQVAARVIQVVLSLTVVLAGRSLALAVTDSEAIGELVALMVSVYPPYMFYASDLTTATIEMVLGLPGIVAVLLAKRRHSVGWAAVAGAMLALAALTRPTWLTLIPLGAVWVALTGGPRRWRLAGALVLASSLVMLPWVLHVRQTQGAWILTSTNGGLNFWIGNNPRATGEYIFPPELDAGLVRQAAKLPEPARDRFFYAEGWRFVGSHPRAALELAGRKLLYFTFFRPGIGSNYAASGVSLGSARLAFVASWLLLLPLALVGARTLTAGRARQTWLVLVWTSQAAMAMFYFAGTRFRTPFDVIVMVWAAAGLVSIWRWWRTRNDREPGPNATAGEDATAGTA